MYHIIKSGSTGNSIIYFNSIAVDAGVPYSYFLPFLKAIQIILLTHRHSDHFNKQTLKRLAFERPTLRFGIGEHMVEYMDGFKNIDVYEPGKIYDYGQFQVSPITLYHDCPNFGYRIFKDGKKILHATDTAHMIGIDAKNYDLYCLESNYDSETVWDKIHEIESRGEFSHQRGSINSHLSFQQANDFYYKNKGEHSQLIRLHESTTSL